jgi:hypothetical protein
MGPDSLSQIGPHRKRPGRSVPAPRGASADADNIRLQSTSQFGAVRTKSLFVPALIEGDVEGDTAQPGRPLAIAVNGRIAATTKTYDNGRHVHFTSLVPEGAFRDGANSVDVYAVRQVSGAVRLARLGGTSTGHAPLQAVRHEARSQPPGEKGAAGR